MPVAPLTMRADLTGVRFPNHVLRAPYSIRNFRKGDDTAWCAIETTAGEFDNETDAMQRGFDESFRANESLLSDRMFFVVDEKDCPVATATAWFEGDAGLMHWVAVHADHQGKGLARPVIIAAMKRMQELGHTQVVLRTHPHSWVAIRLYLECGFKPVWDDAANVITGWKAVYEKLGKEFSKDVCIVEPV